MLLFLYFSVIKHDIYFDGDMFDPVNTSSSFMYLFIFSFLFLVSFYSGSLTAW